VPRQQASFAGSEPVLRYLARFTHRVAISNRRLVDVTDDGVTFISVGQSLTKFANCCSRRRNGRRSPNATKRKF
jgi:hypothetical protein